MSESGTPEATRCPTCGSPDRRVCIPKHATAHRHPHDKWWPPNLEASPGCCADAFHSESGTPEAILSAGEVSSALADVMAVAWPMRSKIASERILTHDRALRAEVERLTAERDAGFPAAVHRLLLTDLRAAEARVAQLEAERDAALDDAAKMRGALIIANKTSERRGARVTALTEIVRAVAPMALDALGGTDTP